MLEIWKLLSCSSFFFLVSVVLLELNFSEAYTIKKPTIEKNLHPVIYVPGFGGSQLHVKVIQKLSSPFLCIIRNYNWFDWINAIEISIIAEHLIGRCWVYNMRLVYNNHTHKTSDVPGVEHSVLGWGDPSTVEWLLRDTPMVETFKNILKQLSSNSIIGFISGRFKYLNFIGYYIKKFESVVDKSEYFLQISNALTELGLVRNISIRSAPYDFRKAPNEQQSYFQNLKQLVEETYDKNQNSTVVLLTHSMGGPMTLNFLHQQTQVWKDKYIKSFISLSGAWGGTMKAIKMYTEGDDLGVDLFSSKTLKDVLVTTPALAWMLPSPEFWGKDEVLASTSKRNYTLSDMEDFFHDINQPIAWEMYKDVLNYTSHFRPPGVEVHCLYGTHRRTLEQIRYGGDFGQLPEHRWSENGDETINLRSLKGCTRWSEMQKEKVYHEAYKDVEHTAILRDRRVIEYIKSVVRGEK